MTNRSIVLTVLLIISIILNIYFASQMFKFKKIYNNTKNAVHNTYEEGKERVNNIKENIKNNLK